MLVLALWKRPSAVLCLLVFAGVASAACNSTCLPDGKQSSGALYRICVPDNSCWNGKLVIYSHGYVAFNEPLRVPDDTLPDGTRLSDLITGLGFAYATTSYAVNGLAIVPALDDLTDLVNIFKTQVSAPARTYLVGPSEGGVITALSLEKYPHVYNAGQSVCGPIGDFRRQLNYIGDFRVVFDYFFPNVIPGSPIDIPQEVIDNWDAIYVPKILAAVRADPSATRQLLSVTDAPGSTQAEIEATVEDVLWYNVFGANDARAKLGGQPFDNMHRIYLGSDNDLTLNLLIQRVAADPAALHEIDCNYQTSGSLINPLVTMHTRGDPIIPYWHEPLYWLKTAVAGAGRLHINIPIQRYGHCNFNAAEVLAGFGLMLLKDGAGQLPEGAGQLLPPGQRRGFEKHARNLGILP